MMVTKFKHLNVPDQWEQYWSRYPQGYTIMEALINWVSQVDLMVDNVNVWNKYLDEFVKTFDKNLQGTVTDILKKWQEDGTLKVIIDEALQTQIDDLEVSTQKSFRDISINIKDFGAKGGEDSTNAIRDAIDYCHKAGGGDVIVPPSVNGQPYIFTTICVKENVTLKGAGGKLKFKDNVCVDKNATYYLIHNMDGLGGSFKKASVVDLYVDGNGEKNTLFSVADIITFLGENTHIINCDLYNAPDSGIMFSGVKNGLCIQNRIDKGTDLGIYVNDGLDGVSLKETIISHNRITNFPNGGIGIKRTSQRIVVEANTITDCGFGITLEHVSGIDFSKNISIINNRLRNIDNTAIILRASIYSVVMGNRIEDFKIIGIEIEGDVRFASVIGNVISSTVANSGVTNKAAIRVRSRVNIYPSFNVIQGNTVKVTSEGIEGIFLYGLESKSSGGEFNTVADNIVEVVSHAFHITSYYKNNTITDNQFSGDGYDMFVGAGTAGNNTLNNRLAHNSIIGSFGGFDHAHLTLGRHTIWMDSNGELRIKASALPTSDTDGTILQKTGVRTYAGNPTGVLTPNYIGEEVRDTTNNRWYKAHALTNNSWQQLSVV